MRDSIFSAVCSFEKRTGARVPVLKIKHSTAGITLDISIENTNAHKKTRFLCACAEIDPRFRTLVCLVKYWAHRRRINDAANKTLNSFAYTLALIQFLQTRSPSILPSFHDLSTANHVSLEEYNNICSDFEVKYKGFGGQNSQSNEDLLAQFMHFMLEICSESYPRRCISVRQGTLKAAAYCDFKEDLLCIEDVFDTTCNVARSVTSDHLSFPMIQNEFSRACQILDERGDFVMVCQCSSLRHAQDRRPVSSAVPRK
jgi:DNA polymerase sigma